MKIVSLDRITLTIGDIDFSPIERLGDVVFRHEVLKPDELAGVIGDAEILLCNKAPITRELMLACPSLRYVGLFATGCNNVDIKFARERNIVVCNVPDYSTPGVVQHVFALLLNFAGSISSYDSFVKGGGWIHAPSFTSLSYPIIELSGKTLGIYGFGAIGRGVAKIASAFGMRVIVCTRTPPDISEYEFVSRDELFSRSDFISIHCPLNEQTQNLVCKDTLSKMKKTAFIINTARGPIVNEKDLAYALNNDLIAGAAADVLSTEPMSADNPLAGAKNIVITPHVAWASKESRQRLVNIAAANISAFLDGNPINVVN